MAKKKEIVKFLDNTADSIIAAEEKIKQIIDSNPEMSELIIGKFLDAEKKIKSYIKKNPKKSAFIAIGIGVAIGAALIVGMDKKKA